MNPFDELRAAQARWKHLGAEDTETFEIIDELLGDALRFPTDEHVAPTTPGGWEMYGDAENAVAARELGAALQKCIALVEGKS